MQSSKVKIEEGERGFALLIAIIISTIVLTIGISIINTALKEVVLASTVRNSTVSFYEADSGAECALYWDNVRGNFEKESAFAPGSSPSTIECQGIKVPIVPSNPLTGVWIRDESNLRKPCVQIDMRSVSVSDTEEKVFLTSWGFNNCDPRNSRRVDRALEVKYSRYK